MEKYKSIGLIAEFNPFHKGHKTYIKKASNLDKDACLICAMSPNFVQRGEFAIFNKENRVKKALKNGIDIVVEIPTIYTIQSANIYADAALSLLNKMHVDQIIFGTESGDTDEFLAKFDNNHFNSPRMDEIIQDYLAKGQSYPKAKAKAIEQVTDFYLENPNDILGYEYVRSIKENGYKFKINCYKRDVNDSASKLRHKIKKLPKIFNYNCNDFYFKTLKYKLTTSTPNELSKLHLIDEGIENLFIKNIQKVSNMNDFINICTSKRYSRARLKRSVIHILLNDTKEYTNSIISNTPPYIRVLGVSNKGLKYLRILSKEYNENIVSRFSAQDNPLLLFELKATELYNLNRSNKVQQKEIKKEMTLYPIKSKK